MSIEAITALWEAKRAEASAKQREAELLEAEARGLRSALDALIQMKPPQSDFIGPRAQSVVKKSVTSHSSTDAQRRSNPGRQPGSISNKWKKHLIELSEVNDIFSKEDVARLVYEREDRLMKPSEVQRLFENFSKYNHVRFVDDGLYVVPEEAISKFRATLRDENPFTEDDNESADDVASSQTEAEYGDEETTPH